jgi:S1-C subfamily serine protease
MAIQLAPDSKRGSFRSTVVPAFATLLVAMVLAVAGCTAPPDSRAAEGQPTTPGHVVVGIGVRDLMSSDLERVGGSDLRGAFIGQVSPGSPAERVGLRIGDVVVQANEQPIVHAEELQRLIGMQQGGAVIRLVIRRAGQIYHVQVTARQESGRIG